MESSTHSQALDRLARLLTVRDHSRFELRQKLSAWFDADLIEQVIDEAHAKGWLKSDAEIAEQAALALARKFKSQSFIEQRLQERQLPVPPLDREAEAEKIRALVAKKFGSCKLTDSERDKALRFLLNQGFDEYGIRMVIE